MWVLPWNPRSCCLVPVDELKILPCRGCARDRVETGTNILTARRAPWRSMLLTLLLRILFWSFLSARPPPFRRMVRGLFRPSERQEIRAPESSALLRSVPELRHVIPSADPHPRDRVRWPLRRLPNAEVTEFLATLPVRPAGDKGGGGGRRGRGGKSTSSFTLGPQSSPKLAGTEPHFPEYQPECFGERELISLPRG